jgi:hypothetical protein
MTTEGEQDMKLFVAAVAITAALTAPGFAQSGNISGAESAGEPVNSSVRLSGRDAQTGLTPGARARVGMTSQAKATKVTVKKKKKKTSVSQ